MENNIEIKNVVVETSEFYGPAGWGREPITMELQIPGKTIGQIFPHQDNKISVTAFDGDKPIGHCNANEWEYFLEKFIINLDNLKENEHEGTKIFVKLLQKVYDVEKNKLLLFLLGKGFEIKKISHNCGIMVISSYGKKGIGKRMVINADEILKKNGYLVNIVETTNYNSMKAFKDNGYEIFASFNLKDNMINVDDTYSVMYKIF